MTRHRGITLIEMLVVLAILGILAALIVPLVDWAAATSRLVPGVVVSKAYQGAETHHGVGLTGKGDMVVTTSSTEEKYIVVARFDGRVQSCTARPEAWADAKDGASVTVRRWYGRLFGGDQGAEVVGVVTGP